jgi:4-hydroxy-2-oxoheptanedioate aldolase
VDEPGMKGSRSARPAGSSPARSSGRRAPRPRRGSRRAGDLAPRGRRRPPTGGARLLLVGSFGGGRRSSPFLGSRRAIGAARCAAGVRRWQGDGLARPRPQGLPQTAGEPPQMRSGPCPGARLTSPRLHGHRDRGRQACRHRRTGSRRRLRGARCSLAAGSAWRRRSRPRSRAARVSTGCLIDGEHAPNDVGSIRAQLMALNGSPSSVVVRVPFGEAWILKRMLDLGAQSLLVPMIDTAEQAREMVRAVRYPPHGVRGVGAGFARASGYGAVADYQPTAERPDLPARPGRKPEGHREHRRDRGDRGRGCRLHRPLGPLGRHGPPRQPRRAGGGRGDPPRHRPHPRGGKGRGHHRLRPGEAKRWAEAGVHFIATASDVKCLAWTLRDIAKAASEAACGGVPRCGGARLPH